MDKSILDKIRDARNDHIVTNINLFNDGSIKEDEYFMAKKVNSISLWENEFILDILTDNASRLSREYNYDSLSMKMLIGLIFKKEDFDENNHLKNNAEPLNNYVRYYTDYVKCYLDGKQQNEDFDPEKDRFIYLPSRQGFTRYNDFVRYVKKSGLSFVGPENFKEFKELILSNQTFDISVDVNLEKENKLVRKLF